MSPAFLEGATIYVKKRQPFRGSTDNDVYQTKSKLRQSRLTAQTALFKESNGQTRIAQTKRENPSIVKK